MKNFTILMMLCITWSTMPMKNMFSNWLVGTTDQRALSSKQQRAHQTQESLVTDTQGQKTEPVSLQTAGPTTVNVNVINSPTFKNRNDNYSQANADVHVNNTAYAHAELYQVWESYCDQLQKSWQDNKLACGAILVGSIYSYYCYQVISGNFYLQRKDLWSSWKGNLSFDELCAIPHQNLAHELVLTIQHHGLDMQRPTDFTVPLVVFLQAIDQERAMLLYYQTLYNRIIMMKCRWLFPFNSKCYEQIEGRLQRLSFVKNIFISWMAAFNLEHAKSYASYATPPSLSLKPL